MLIEWVKWVNLCWLGWMVMLLVCNMWPMCVVNIVKKHTGNWHARCISIQALRLFVQIPAGLSVCIVCACMHVCVGTVCVHVRVHVSTCVLQFVWTHTLRTCTCKYTNMHLYTCLICIRFLHNNSASCSHHCWSWSSSFLFGISSCPHNRWVLFQLASSWSRTRPCTFAMSCRHLK